MWSVDRPPFTSEEAFAAFISKIRDRDLRHRLEDVAEYISIQAISYAKRAAASKLHLVQSAANVNGTVTAEEMVSLYDYRMATKGGSWRHIYDATKLLPKHGICPFCDHRPVSTLDHLLPKRLFPTLAVAPDNLVGACADCNKLKLDFAPVAESEVFLHPYFDRIETRRWLTAEVVEGPVAAVIFRPQPVVEWSTILNERVRRQFHRLGLGRLYGAQAAREISAQALLLSKIYDRSGAAAVRAELVQQAETREAISLNSWQGVTYRALSACNWFCNGGFSGA
jgi:hypothetical protein